MHKLTIETQGEHVIITFHDKDAFQKSKHIVEARMGNVVELENVAYASFHDEIPRYQETVLNYQIKRRMKV